MAGSPTNQSTRSKRIAAVTLAATIAAGAEGLRQAAYHDPVGILTVCYGHTGNDFTANRRYTLQECRQWLDNDMLTAIDAVDRCHPNLPDNVLAAFGDAVYNMGPKIACNSTASKYLSEGKIKEACKELPKWNKAGGFVLPGLTKRRQAEMELCLTPTP